MKTIPRGPLQRGRRKNEEGLTFLPILCPQITRGTEAAGRLPYLVFSGQVHPPSAQRHTMYTLAYTDTEKRGSFFGGGMVC